MKERFYSLDVFRGATVALMILVNNPGSWANIYPPLKHAPWHGCTPTDLVFPFFLFAVGNAMAFVMPGLANHSVFWKKITKRALLIFAIGLFLNWFPFVKYNADGALVAKQLANLRIFGVLQRIAVCYFFAAIIVHYLKWWGTFIMAISLLMVYWLLCLVYGAADPYSLPGWFGTSVDLALLGAKHMYSGEGIAFDPEGLASVLAPIAQVCFGYLVGHYIISKGKTTAMLTRLVGLGVILVLCGIAWSFVFPLNKKIWTSSYTVYTTGLAILVLSVLMYTIEFKKWTGAWSRFFDVFGKNALFIFTLSGLLPRLLNLIRIPNGVASDGALKFVSPYGWFYQNVCAKAFPADARFGSLLYALIFIALMWSIAWYLNKKKIYVKV